MALTLAASATPDRVAQGDVVIRLVLRNTGGAPIAIAPAVAKLAAVASFAGVGITWELALGDARITELRRWYGPPGNPPAPSFIKQYEVTLAPGAEHVTELAACWIPHLEPRQRAQTTLDPQGIDGLGPIGDVGVLVIGATSAQLDRTGDDFLRGHVVAFVGEGGRRELRVSYVQRPWLKVGEQHEAVAAPVAIDLLR